VTTPLVSVVVVTWNSAAVVGDCLASLRNTVPSIEWELTVVDNASADGTVDAIRAAEPQARVIVNHTNRGLAAANNQGLCASGGALLLICNPDVIFQAGSVTAMIDVMHRRPRAGWVVPRLIYEDGSLQTSAGDLPKLSETLLGRQVSRRRSTDGTVGFWWDKWPHDEERIIGRGHEAAFMVRRDAVDEVGLQDERYVLDWEGLDWTDRFRRANWEIWLTPTAEVVHLGGASIRQVPFRWVVSQHRGMYYYFADRRPRAMKPLLAVAFGLRAGIKMAAIGLRLPLYQWGHRDRHTRRDHSG
jgi:GT2 family glycosyltransferase